MSTLPSWVEATLAAGLFVAASVATDVFGDESFPVKLASYAAIGVVVWLLDWWKSRQVERAARAVDLYVDLFCYELFRQIDEDRNENDRLPFKVVVMLPGFITRCCRTLLRLTPPVAILRPRYAYNSSSSDPDYELQLWNVWFRTPQGASWKAITEGRIAVFRRPRRGPTDSMGMTETQQNKTREITALFAQPIRRIGGHQPAGTVNLILTNRDYLPQFEELLASLNQQNSQLRRFVEGLSEVI